ncbi:dihydropteroate synthase [Litorivicinus lipolyticus]|nr:dihydropteroate synthase [Litorivicinus lipolyticus]
MTEIMAVMNLTPDSFSDGGQIDLTQDAVLARAIACVAEGATWLDLGGESTRPGAESVSEAEEQARVLPALEWIKARVDVKVSLDTSTPSVMQAGLALGADMINDVRALTRPGALEVCAQSEVPLVLMHMQGTPLNMQAAPEYQDVVGEVMAFLQARVAACADAGIGKERLVLDPGFGFGKSLEHNRSLFASIDAFQRAGFDTLIGVSRKRMIGDITGQPVEGRAVGSAVAAALAAKAGARWVRVHDVAATRDAIAVMNSLG